MEIAKVKRSLITGFLFLVCRLLGISSSVFFGIENTSNDKDLPDSHTDGTCGYDSDNNVYPEVVVAIVGLGRSSASEESLHSRLAHDGAETELVQVNGVDEVPGVRGVLSVATLGESGDGNVGALGLRVTCFFDRFA